LSSLFNKISRLRNKLGTKLVRSLRSSDKLRLRSELITLRSISLSGTKLARYSCQASYPQEQAEAERYGLEAEGHIS